ncbi:amiloride-sensitive sodium channel subunit alpha [Biomphalaria glabrata]|nr:amiloride-sensitive sodium channel subunit alpha [Biomphalaria glabrata]
MNNKVSPQNAELFVSSKHDVNEETETNKSTPSVRTAAETFERKFLALSIISNFAQKTSVNGALFIKESSSIQAKIWWSVLFLAAIGALLLHSYSIISSYMSFRTMTTVESRFEKNLQLPFVTFCNRNPIRLSMLNQTSSLLQNYVHNLNIDELIMQNEDSDIQESSDFKLFYSSALGNCYTLDTRSYIQQVEGSNEGLDIGIFLEPDEYIEELTETKGLQVLVHDTQSFVFPYDDGFQLLPGTFSNIALTLINTKNSPWPYGDCVDDMNDEYLRKYNYIYEFYFCNEICYNAYVLEKCKCLTTEYSDLLGSQGSADNQSLCSRDFTSYNCSTEALYDDYVCKCSKACSINTYNYRVTSLEWPTFKTGKVMVEYLCGRISMSRCKQLRKLSYRDLRENFVGMKIFF